MRGVALGSIGARSLKGSPYPFLVLVPLTLALEGRFPRPARHQWSTLVAMALTGVVLFNALVYLSLLYTTSTNAALINGTTPILTMVLAAAIGLDRLTGRRLAGALVSSVGVGWIVSRGSFGGVDRLVIQPRRSDYARRCPDLGDLHYPSQPYEGCAVVAGHAHDCVCARRAPFGRHWRIRTVGSPIGAITPTV